MPLLHLLKPLLRNSTGHDPEEFRATLVEHIDELRSRILRILGFLVVGWFAGYYLQPVVSNILQKRALRDVPAGKVAEEIWTNFTDPFLFKLKFSFFLGLILVFPFITWQLWGFIKPGLKQREIRPFRVVVPASMLLFLLGASLCWIVVPMAVHWFISYLDDFPGTKLMQQTGTMTIFLVKMIAAFGVAFQLPVVVFFLAKIGLLTQETLWRNWRQATVGIFIAAMVLTPSNDPPSMLMMAIPMTLLYLLTIVAVRWTTKREPRDPVLNALDG